MTLPINAQTAKFDNLEAIQDAFGFDPAKTYKVSAAASTSAFAGNNNADVPVKKTNKYAEGESVIIITQTKGVHVRWSADGTEAATTNDPLLFENTRQRLTVPKGKPYLNLIQAAATAVIWVIEE